MDGMRFATAVFFERASLTNKQVLHQYVKPAGVALRYMPTSSHLDREMYGSDRSGALRFGGGGGWDQITLKLKASSWYKLPKNQHVP